MFADFSGFTALSGKLGPKRACSQYRVRPMFGNQRLTMFVFLRLMR